MVDSSVSSPLTSTWTPPGGLGLVTPPNPRPPAAEAPASLHPETGLCRSNVGGRLQRESKGERVSEPTQSAPSPQTQEAGRLSDASAPGPRAAALTFVLLLVLQVIAVQHVEQPQHWGGEHHQVLDVRGWRHSGTQLEARPEPAGGPGQRSWDRTWS